jgi:hypothetical protein
MHPVNLALGLALLVLGYAGTLWAYAAMGDTWRIGINRNEKTTLVNRGPYRLVRHPIYLFQSVMLAGAALLLPTPVSFLILATGGGRREISDHGARRGLPRLSLAHGRLVPEIDPATVRLD